jgi:hypothetical protein
LQWLIGREETQNNEGITNEEVLCHARSHVKKKYKILEHSICQVGFKNVFCIGNHMLERFNRLRDQDVVMPKYVGRVRTSVSYILESWMEEFFSRNCKKLPNKDVSHLLDNFSKLEVSKLFKSKLSNFDQCGSVTYQFWCKIWNKHFPLIKMPKVNHFGACADCKKFKTICEKTLTIEKNSKHH